jgi:hypothetical protein
LGKNGRQLHTHLQTCNVGTKERSKFATAPLTLTLVTHLIVEYVRFDLNAFINIAVLQLNETGRYGGNVALLVRKGDTAGTLCEENIKNS